VYPHRTMTGMKNQVFRAAETIRSHPRISILMVAGIGYVFWVLIGSQSHLRVSAGMMLLVLFQAITAIEFWKEARRKDPHFVRTWQVISAAAFLWVIADVILSLVWFSEKAVPSAPSLWHWIRFAGHLAFLLGVSVFPLVPSERYSRLRTIFDLLTLFLTITGLFWAIWIQPVLKISLFLPIPFLWESAIVLLDLVLIVFFFRIFALINSSRYPSNTYLLFSAAFIIFLLGDLTVLFSLLYEYLSLDFVSGSWLIANLVFLLGINLVKNSKEEKASRGLSNVMQRRVEFWMPIVLAYLTTGYILIHWYITDTPDWIGLGFIIAVSIALIARQGVIAGQYEVRQFKTLVDTVSSPAFICTPDGSLRLLNPSMKKLAASISHPQTITKIDEIFSAEVLFEDIFVQAGEGGWSGVVSSAGDGNNFSLSLQPILDESRKVSLLAGSAYDLSEILQREKALQHALNEVDSAKAQLENLNIELEQKVEARTLELQRSVQRLGELNEELKELDRLKSEFVTLVSHELRAPLTIIETGVELAARELKSSGVEPSETLSLVQRETRRLEVFIETILDISALEAGKVHFESAPIDLYEMIRSVVDQFRKTNLDTRLEISIPESIPQVLAESRALFSVLYHLIDNVVKYAPEGAVRLKVEMEDSGVLLCLCDEGPGIPDKERDRVFELFHRLDSSDDRETYGYGLGLSIAKRFLEAMDGWIRISDAETSGTCIKCWLPAVNTDSSTL